MLHQGVTGVDQSKAVFYGSNVPFQWGKDQLVVLNPIIDLIFSIALQELFFELKSLIGDEDMPLLQQLAKTYKVLL